MGIFDIFKKRPLAAKNKSTSATPSQIRKIKLDDVYDRYTSRVSRIGDCIEVFSYLKVPVSNVDRWQLASMVAEQDYAVTPVAQADGSISLMRNGCHVAHLSGRVQMCADWLRRGDPVRCEFTGFHGGSEHVVLCFYRNEEKRLSHHSTVTVKLTAYSSEAKQESICLLQAGDKLTCDESDTAAGRVDVKDYSGENIGRLPKKYSDIFIEDGFAGIFVDQLEEDCNGIIVPHVKIYL